MPRAAAAVDTADPDPVLMEVQPSFQIAKSSLERCSTANLSTSDAQSVFQVAKHNSACMQRNAWRHTVTLPAR